MTITAIAILVAGFAAVLAVATLVFDVRRRKHKGLSREEFIRVFTRTGIPENIPEAVYKFYTRSWFFRNLRVAPDDSLEHILSEGNEDIEQDAMLLIKKLGLKAPSEEAQLRWNERIQAERGTTSGLPRFSMELGASSPIQTVREMVLWLDWARQQQESNT